MAIDPVNLNVDPSGYAGSIVSPLRVRNLRMPTIRGLGSFQIPEHLKRQAALRNAIAKAELQMLRQELNDRRKPRSMSIFDRQMEETALKQAGAQARGAQEQSRQEGIATMARLGRLGQAMSNPDPRGFGSMDRAAAYGTLSGLSGGSGIADRDEMDQLKALAGMQRFAGAGAQRTEPNRYGYGVGAPLEQFEAKEGLGETYGGTGAG